MTFISLVYLVFYFILFYFFLREENEQKFKYVHGLLEASVPHPKINGGVRTPATPPVAEPML